MQMQVVFAETWPSVQVAHVSAKARPDWARSQDRSALTLSLPDQGGLTEEDGDEGGKDGVGQEGPRGDTRGE